MEVDGRWFVAIFVIILAVGSISTFLLITVIGNDDPYDVSHSYVVDATLDGVDYEGSGVSKYTPESDSYRTYQFTLAMVDYNGKEETMEFGIIFGTDDAPDRTIFSFMGTELMGGRTISVWTASYGGSVYTYHIGDMCTVEKLEISSERGIIAAYLTD